MPDAIQILNENRASLLFFVISVVEAKPQMKLVTKRKPIFIEEHNEPLQRSVVRIHQLLCQSANLGGSVPAVRAVDQNIISLLQKSFYYHVRCLEDS